MARDETKCFIGGFLPTSSRGTWTASIMYNENKKMNNLNQFSLALKLISFPCYFRLYDSNSVMQLFNLHCCRFLPFVFLLVQCITPDPSENDDDDVAQSIASPPFDGSNNLIAASENALPTDGGSMILMSPLHSSLLLTRPTTHDPSPPQKNTPSKKKSGLAMPVLRLYNSSPEPTRKRNQDRAIVIVPQRRLRAEVALTVDHILSRYRRGTHPK